jgi:hypothetical protein
VGTISEYDALVAQYPFAEWKWGGTYNNVNPMPLIVVQWNRGLRVTFKNPYPQGLSNRARTRTRTHTNAHEQVNVLELTYEWTLALAGDDGGALTMGNAMWTRGTDDLQTKECKNPDGSPGMDASDLPTCLLRLRCVLMAAGGVVAVCGAAGFYHRYIGVDGKPHLRANGRVGLVIWVKRY